MNMLHENDQLFACFRWRASEKLRQQEMIATGKPSPNERWARWDMATLTPDQRAAILEVAGISLSPQNSVFDAEPTVEQAVEVMRQEAAARRAKWAAEQEAQAEQQRRREIAKQCIAEIETLEKAGDLPGLRAYRAHYDRGLYNRNSLAQDRAFTDVSRAQERAIRELEKAQREAEKATWIEAQGSDHLKRAFAGGYNCQRLYVTERAAVEAPGFVVDFDDAAQWKDRSCPSMAALEVEEAANQWGIGKVMVVWLTTGPSAEVENEDEYGEPYFQEVEAVIIRGYLGRYDLVKII